MAKARSGYRCSNCEAEFAAFAGRCSQCQEWNTLTAFAELGRQSSSVAAVTRRVTPSAPTGRMMRLADVTEDEGQRLATGIEEFDRVLGGGLVPGSLVLVGGEPGIGKSTLMLQAAARVAGAGMSVAYVCGEESPRQVRLRAARLGLGAAEITLIPETNLDVALATALASGARVAVIDSVQAMFIEGLDTRSGGPAQLAESGTRLVAWAKEHEIATLVTGHVTKAGEIAGPRLLEHLVDAVLYFEGAEGGTLRVLRAIKNRFGATDEVGVFEMTGEGLRSVDNPSAAFLEQADLSASGCAVTAVIEGSRPIAVELQALAVPSYLATPRRIASGIETSRLHLMLAVLARRGGLQAGNMDVVATVSAGLRLKDTGADLAILCALASAIKDVPLGRETAFLGEVALSGGIRPVPNATRRLAELARLGFRRCLAAPGASAPGITVVPVGTVREALAAILTGA
jgi:DNA repair protein RadA/Sms